MTPAELAAHVKDATGVVRRDEIAHDQLSLWVDPADWYRAAQHLRECGHCRFDFFTFLTAVDMEEQGFEIVMHVLSVRRQHSVNLKTTVARDGGSLQTVSDLWRGAAWHERETAELFGVGFTGHPNLAKLLLPEEFEGYPLRKDFLLMTREIKEWPGLKEPAEHGAGGSEG